MAWRNAIIEFLKAAVRRGSYDPRRNLYFIFGFLWALPIPFYSAWFGLKYMGESYTFGNVGLLIRSQPWQIFFITHPLLFAAILGILGTVYHAKEQEVEHLLCDLRAKVKELKKVNRELEKLDTMKTEFMSNVTHELKTPLVTIQGYTDMLLSGRLGDLYAKQQKALEVMNRNQKRLSELILQLLRYDRMGESTKTVFKAPISVYKLFRYLKNAFLPAMEKKGITFKVELPATDVCIMGQEDMIEQVMRNLLGNARKFTDSGGTIRLSTGLRRYPEKVALIVEDDGCGISEDALPYIFERFRQGDGSIRRKYGGTGLGLAIVKKVIDSHKASIAVDSKPGEGTRFTVVLEGAPKGLIAPGKEQRHE